MKRKYLALIQFKNNYLSPNHKKYDIKIAMDGVKRSCLDYGSAKSKYGKNKADFS